MKNKIKHYTFLTILIPVLLLLSCNSNSFPVPGQNKIFQENLYKEYLNLGNGYYQIEKYSEAIKFYQKVLENKELGNIAYYKIAQCYALLKDWGNALPMYEKMLEEDPENQSVKANIAYIYSMTGEVNKALASYQELIEMQPSNITYLENYLAIILSDKKFFNDNKNKFEDIFNSLKENYPKNENIELFQKKYDEYTADSEKESEKKLETNPEKEEKKE